MTDRRALLWLPLTAVCGQIVACWVSQPARELNQGHYLFLAALALLGLVPNLTAIALLAGQLRDRIGPNRTTALVVLPFLLWHGAALLPVSGLGSRELLLWVNLTPEPAANFVYHALLTAAFTFVFVLSLLPHGREVPQRA